MRIGQKAAGLAILASFYEEFSRNAINLANKVSEQTITKAKHSVEEWRIDLFEQQLERACNSLKENEIPDAIQQKRSQNSTRQKKNAEGHLRFTRNINDLLEEMRKNIRSIAVIAVNSKIEAPNTGEHYGALLDMAAGVEDMITQILVHIDEATAQLSKYSTVAVRTKH